MNVQPVRPKNLNLFTIHFPLPAIVSILHRISGVILFFFIVFLIWGLDLSLTISGFDRLQGWFELFYVRLAIWFLFIPFCFHLVAGIRHLLMDIHIGTSLVMGRLMSALTLVISFLLIIFVGVWLW